MASVQALAAPPAPLASSRQRSGSAARPRLAPALKEASPQTAAIATRGPAEQLASNIVPAPKELEGRSRCARPSRRRPHPAQQAARPRVEAPVCNPQPTDAAGTAALGCCVVHHAGGSRSSKKKKNGGSLHALRRFPPPPAHLPFCQAATRPPPSPVLPPLFTSLHPEPLHPAGSWSCRRRRGPPWKPRTAGGRMPPARRPTSCPRAQRRSTRPPS